MPPKQVQKASPKTSASPTSPNSGNKKSIPSSPVAAAVPDPSPKTQKTAKTPTAAAASSVAKVVEKAPAKKDVASPLKTQLESLYESRREHITLLQQPVLCLRLFVEIAAIEGFALACRILKHPLMMFGGIPIIFVSLVISLYVIPSNQQSLFRSIDLDNDGSVTAQEIATSTGSTLGAVLEALGGVKSFNFEEFAAWHTASLAEGKQSAVSNFVSYLPHNYWREGEYILADVLWWFGLGVLSSIGLGTGMHSGLLFLFPMIFQACRAADACGSSNFWTYPTNIFYGPRERAFTCVEPFVSGAEPVSLLIRFLKVAPWCMIWGAGTALGEIPPYLLAYAAAKEGRKTAEIEEGLTGSSWNILNRMMQWMLEKIKKHGFWAILLLAAWPNAAFDLCGMACGQFLMPFWTFFGATLIGKSLIKINMQTLFFVLLFSGDTIESFLKAAAAKVGSVLPPSIPVAAGIEKAVEMLANTRTRFSDKANGRAAEAEGEEKGPNYFQIAMQWVVVLAVGWFAKSIIDTFAQKRQQSKDEDAIEALLEDAKTNTAKGANDAVVKRASDSLNSRALKSRVASVGLAAVAIAYVVNRYYF
eukprot:GILI01017783.1.p1 GENE.GILI01017783.1~~GILI01017783.1.p1  ORF type:complete len:589 (+),score=172.05 GILI01017783.1:71-1837(+)